MSACSVCWLSHDQDGRRIAVGNSHDGADRKRARMSPLPAEFTNRWQDRAELAPGQGLVYWHMLVGRHPEVTAQARDAQTRLASFTGLHMTPLEWLHMTTLIAGPADQISAQDSDRMAAAASRLLADTAPITVTFEKVLYHAEAIMLAATPPAALAPVRDAVQAATREVTGTNGQAAHAGPWTPHVTVCYSTSHQPAGPVIEALGRYLPPAEVQIGEVSLVIQRGPERLWDWQPIATVHLGELSAWAPRAPAASARRADLASTAPLSPPQLTATTTGQGESHPDTLRSRSNLAAAYDAAGRHADAEATRTKAASR